MANLHTKINLENLVNFVTILFVFVIMIDPANIIFKIKLPLFAILIFLCILCYPKVEFRLINQCLIIYGIFAITTLVGFFLGYNVNTSFSMYFYMSFLMIWALLWSQHLRIIDRLVLPGIVISIIVGTIYIVVMIFPQFEIPIYAIVHSQFEGILMISKRTFIGIDIFSVYYTSAPVLLIVMAVYFHRLLNNSKGKFHNFIIWFLLFIPLVLGGTRAMMLSSIGIIYIVLIVKMWSYKGGRLLAFVSVVFAIIGSVFIMFQLLGDSDEKSLQTKTILLEAFFHHIENHPETLLWGNGVGATFDSLGVRGSMAFQSEWTYLELIRWFGIPLTIVFLFVYVYPLLSIYNKRKKLPYAIPIMVSYIFYLFLAGTNPYLYSSNGILTLLLMYSYSQNLYYEKSAI